MSKRIIVEFTCDVCQCTAEVYAVMPVNTGRETKLYSYPRGWATLAEDTSKDICRKCVKKADEHCRQARSSQKVNDGQKA